MARGLVLAFVLVGLASPVAAQQLDAEPIDLALPHYIGVQIGGSGYFQAAARIRVAGPLIFEIGGLGFGLNGAIALNGSLGLSLEYTMSVISPFVSGGFGGGLGCGEGGEEEVVDPETGETTYEGVGLSCGGTAFEYTRIGINIHFTEDRVVMLSLDGGFWYGTIGDEGEPNRTFFSPMFGVGFYTRFPFVKS